MEGCRLGHREDQLVAAQPCSPVLSVCRFSCFLILRKKSGLPWIGLESSQIAGCFLHLLSGGMSWILPFIFSGQNTGYFCDTITVPVLGIWSKSNLHLNTGLSCVKCFACAGASSGSLNECFGWVCHYWCCPVEMTDPAALHFCLPLDHGLVGWAVTNWFIDSGGSWSALMKW